MTVLHPITALREMRKKSRKGHTMPVSSKPRRAYADRNQAGIAGFTRAGTLFYSWYEHAMQRKLAGPSMEDVLRQNRRKSRKTTRVGKYRLGFRTRQNRLGSYANQTMTFAACDPAGSRPALRRQRQNLAQHPSVVARFASHPTQADVQAAIAEVETPSLGAAIRLNPFRKIDGETKRERDARIKREKRAQDNG